MSKKYVPSGYQIINIDVSDKTSGTAFTPETEDEKLLFELLSGNVKKPILLKIITTNVEFMGFALWENGAEILSIADTSYVESIVISGTKLLWSETSL